MAHQGLSSPQTPVDVVLASRGDITFRDGIKIEVIGRKVSSLNEAWEVVMGVEGAERAAAVAEMAGRLIEIKNKLEDRMMDWSLMAGDETKLGLGEEDLSKLANLLEPFRTVVKDVEKSRKEKDNNIQTLLVLIEAKTPTKRGDAFKSYIGNHLLERGKNFFILIK